MDIFTNDWREFWHHAAIPFTRSPGLAMTRARLAALRLPACRPYFGRFCHPLWTYWLLYLFGGHHVQPLLSPTTHGIPTARRTTSTPSANDQCVSHAVRLCGNLQIFKLGTQLAKKGGIKFKLRVYDKYYWFLMENTFSWLSCVHTSITKNEEKLSTKGLDFSICC